MTAIELTTSYSAPSGPDHLAGAVIRSLGQRLRQKSAWGVFRTLLAGLVSFGVLPLLLWPRRFADFVHAERLQLAHLAQWVRWQLPSPEADALAAAAERVRFREGFWIVSLALLILGGLFVGGHLFNPGSSLWDVTYGFFDHPYDTTLPLYATWIGVLSVGYLCHALQVRTHAADMRRFVEAINRLAKHQGLSAVQAPAMGVGVGPGWLLAGAILMFMGVLWALPLVIAGGFQRRYTLVTSGQTRRLIADRLAALMRVRRPGEALQAPLWLKKRCVRELCRGALPDQARFCPRCGAPVMGNQEMDHA